MTSRNICKFVRAYSQGSLDVANFVYESEAPQQAEPAARPTHVMYLVTGGEGEYRTDRLSRKLMPGTLFFSFAGLPFSIRNTGELCYLYISFSGMRAEELFRRFGITPLSCVFPGFESLVPVWRDRLIRANGENIDLITESMLLYAFSKMREESGKQRDHIGKLLAFLEEHFTEPDLTLASAAEATGYHPKYLSHLFKKQLGTGFSEYLKTLRIQRAFFLIGQGVTSVKNIALLSGYGDPMYFSRVFKKETGLSPTDYIAKL